MSQLATAADLLFMLSYSNKCIRLLIYIFRHVPYLDIAALMTLFDSYAHAHK